MPLTDPERLAALRLHPRLTDLWLALQPLKSVASFAQSGAHPDDEMSGMLAALRFRDGLGTAYINSTRGEGGQNDIGSETLADLGTIRTAEMERACGVLDMRMWWLSDSPADPITDFGFSKSGTETLGKWDHGRSLARFVEIVRQERPDMLCTTFLDVGGQHGHHRAMTMLAHEVFEAAADPAFPSNRPVWEVKKLYLPGWGGGGGAYDDDEPPPPATVTIPGAGADPVTGWTWLQIGEMARMFHATQGMGHWPRPGKSRDWPLHLVYSRVGPDEGAVTDNLALTLADIGLAVAQEACDAARAAFPDYAGVAAHAARALALLDAARPAPGDAHRVLRKRRELARVLRLAAGISARGRTDRDLVLPGGALMLAVEAEGARVLPAVPPGWSVSGEGPYRLEVPPDAPPSDPYPAAFDPLDPVLPALEVSAEVAGTPVALRLPLEVTPLVGAPVSAGLVPEKLFLNLALPAAPVEVGLEALRPAGAAPQLALPPGWGQAWQGGVATLLPPPGLPEGLVEAPLTLDGRPALTERHLVKPHIAPRLRCFPAVLHLRAARVVLPGVRVGYAGAGNDRVLHWLRAMGLEAEELTDARLASAAPFEGLDAVVVGVFGFTRPTLSAAVPQLHAWTGEGGTLVTLYHRPRDNWDPGRTPPARIEIGMPSLRWRVTDETAAVTHLEPGHPVLSGPNPIGPADWEGWRKERGLYFARSWDPAYRPLLAMADPGEAPLTGALLSAEIGRGRHSHVALGLHHQMNELVPGAFRLMANLVARR